MTTARLPWHRRGLAQLGLALFFFIGVPVLLSLVVLAFLD